jgi:hypothetical protein
LLEYIYVFTAAAGGGNMSHVVSHAGTAARRFPSNFSSVVRWVRKHGHQLRQLRMNLVMLRDLSGLCCPNLQRLTLHGCVLDCSDAGSAFCSSISTATELTSLHINKCKLLVQSNASKDVQGAAAAQFLSALAPLTALQELSVCGVGIFTGIRSLVGEPSGYVLLTTATLQPLQHLTQLQLQAGGGEADGLVQHIGSMTDLQDLRLGGPVTYAPMLQLAVTQLTTLTKLQRLGLRGVTLRNGGTATGAAALLSWLPKLQGLSSLQLRSVTGMVPTSPSWLQAEPLFPADADYRSLTIGSNLQEIDLRGTKFTQAAWKCAFPLVDKLPGITSLRLGDSDRDSMMSHVASAVGSCSSLQRLQVATSTSEVMMPSVKPALMLTSSSSSITTLTVPVRMVLERHPNAQTGAWGHSLQPGRQFAQFVGLTHVRSLQLLALSWKTMHDLIKDLRQLTPLTQLSFLGLKGNIEHRDDALLWDSLASAAQLGAEADGCNWAFVSKVS